jgi:hypothetical protein
MPKTLPFSIPGLYRGLGACHGLLRDEGTHLCLEFQVQDNLLGIVRTGPTTVRIPIKDLQSVELQKGWFSTTLVLQAGSLQAVGQVPGSRQGKIELVIDKRDRPLAEEMVAGLYETG